MRHHKPWDDEVEEKNRVNCESFAVRRLTVAHEDDRSWKRWNLSGNFFTKVFHLITVSRPHESSGGSQEPKEKCEVCLCNHQDGSADDERHGERHQAVPEHANGLEKWSEKAKSSIPLPEVPAGRRLTCYRLAAWSSTSRPSRRSKQSQKLPQTPVRRRWNFRPPTIPAEWSPWTCRAPAGPTSPTPSAGCSSPSGTARAWTCCRRRGHHEAEIRWNFILPAHLRIVIGCGFTYECFFDGLVKCVEVRLARSASVHSPTRADCHLPFN